ncbi:MAG: tetratricopeptide repeat protein [Armatimonadota bacterium]
MHSAPSGEDRERFERLLRDAHLLRMRQQWAQAETLCREAVEIDPQDVPAREMLADLLAEKGETDEALTLYQACLEQQPGKPSLEEKVARIALRKDQEERDRIAAQLMLENPKGGRERKRNATAAVLLSALFPGGGQLFLGQHAKGGVLLVVGLITLYFGVPELMKLLGTFAAAPAAGGRRGPVVEVDGPMAALGLVFIAVYIYSLLDASAQAGKNDRQVSV